MNAAIYLARGDELNAALSLASCIPVAGSAATIGKLANKADNLVDAAKSLRKVEKAANARRLGREGEETLRSIVDIGRKKAIKTAGRTRITNGLTRKALSEAKNVAYQGWTRQLDDYAAYAHDKGLRFDLYVRTDTHLSPKLVAMWKNMGRVNVEPML